MKSFLGIRNKETLTEADAVSGPCEEITVAEVQDYRQQLRG